MAAGAVGLSVAKTSEAEVFADAGFGDLFVAYPVVGADKGRRLLALAERLRTRSGRGQRRGGRDARRDVFHAAGRQLDVVLKVDIGLHRVGVPPRALRPSRGASPTCPGCDLRGLFTHAGHAYGPETARA